MSNDLARYQIDFKKYLLEDSPLSQNILNRLSKKSLAGIEQNFSIYKNNYYFSLTEALGSLYPVVKRLVGDGFFEVMAKGYIKHNPPRSPLINLYGSNFSGYIAEQEKQHGLQYLSEIALLEYNLYSALHAKDELIFDVNELSKYTEKELSNLHFYFHPSVVLQTSTFPIDSIWHENQKSNVGSINLNAGHVYLLIYRRDYEVKIVSLKKSVYKFLTILINRVVLSNAWEEVVVNTELEDKNLSGLLRYFFSLEILIDAELSE